jgi:cellulose biosynthesis protein BcsQ
MGVPMHQIHELDIANCFDGVGWSSKTYVQASDKVWGKQENKDDFTHADFKYSAGQQLYAKVKEQIEVDEKRDYVDEGNRSFVENYDTQWKAGKLTDDCLASFLEAFAKDRCAPPSQVPTPATSCEQPAVASKGSDGTSSRPAALDTDLRPKVPVLKPLDGCGGSDVKPKCVVISVFNYKGGVAKTTTAIQLAATLAKKGSKVCLVDADGQCNSTLFQSNRLRKCRRHSPNAKFLQTSCPRTRRPFTWFQSGNDYDFNSNNIHGMLAPVFSVDGRIAALKAPKLLSVHPEFYKDNLLLLPGSIELSTVRLKHPEDKDECRQFGVLRKLFKMIAQANSTAESPLEFIIIDLGPSADDLNKAFVMSSDYVLPPVKADYFSASSVQGLLYEVLPQFRNWQIRHNRKFDGLSPKERKDLEQDGYYDFKDAEWPRLLPFLVCGHPVEVKNEQQLMEQVSADFLHSIRILVEECGNTDGDDEIKSEVRAGVKKMIVRDKDGHAAVPFCRDLPLAPSVGHRSGVPFVHLGRDDMNVDFDKHRKEVGAGKNANMGKKESAYAKERFDTLAEFVKDQRLVCLRERYEIDEAKADDDNCEPLMDQGGPSPPRRTPQKRSWSSPSQGSRKSSRLAEVRR